MKYKPEYYRYLPHFQPMGVAFFVTGRLTGSLPIDVLRRLKEEKDADLRRIHAEGKDKESVKEDMKAHHQRHFERWDHCLDTNRDTPQWLSQPEVAGIVKNAFHFWDAQFYNLVAYTIMPNHFHLVIDTTDEAKFTKPLYAVMHSIKSYTAKKANKVLGRTGTFWQEESYDHIIRDGQEFKNSIAYTLENPMKAGLVEDWEEFPFSYLNEDYW